jgi:serine/threonine protein kinase
LLPLVVAVLAVLWDRRRWRRKAERMLNFPGKITFKENISTPVGTGGNGCVFVGQLATGEEVAVKESKNETVSHRQPLSVPSMRASLWFVVRGTLAAPSPHRTSSQSSCAHLFVQVITTVTRRAANRELQREAVTLASFKHPNVVRVYGFRTTPRCQIIMEYCSQGSLHKWIADNPDVFLTWEQRVYIAQGIALGMANIHAKDCVHLDLKPGNVLLEVCVTVFVHGRACRFQSLVESAQEGQWCGTHLCMLCTPSTLSACHVDLDIVVVRTQALPNTTMLTAKVSDLGLAISLPERCCGQFCRFCCW